MEKPKETNMVKPYRQESLPTVVTHRVLSRLGKEMRAQRKSFAVTEALKNNVFSAFIQFFLLFLFLVGLQFWFVFFVLVLFF